MVGQIIGAKVSKKISYILGFIISIYSANLFAMGLRSFVALPLEQGGIVLRLQDIDNLNTDRNIAIANIALGITGKQALLFGIPYRLSPSGPNRSGDISFLYRYTAWCTRVLPSIQRPLYSTTASHSALNPDSGYSAGVIRN